LTNGPLDPNDPHPNNGSNNHNNHHQLHRLSGRDLVAIILAFGASAAVLTASIGSVVDRAFEITATEGQLLGTVIGASIGAVATYLGGRSSEQE